MFENLCALPVDHDIFVQAIHPEEPIVAVGLANGEVHTYRLPPGVSDDDDDDSTLASVKGFGTIDQVWRTRRHKGSCRTLGYSLDGTSLYSAGTDGIVKVADCMTGQVTAKIAIPLDPSNGGIDAPTLVHALSPQSLILTTDSGALHIYDIRNLKGGEKVSLKPENTHRPHDDYVSSLTPLPPTKDSTSGFSKQWVTTGGSTLAVTDIRRGVMVRSEDQEEELLCSVIVTGLPKKGSSVGEKVIVGAGNGVLTLWERGVWDDQDERIIVDRSKGGGESLDSMTVVPDGVGPGGKHVAVGLGNGGIRFAKIGSNKIVAELKHDELSQESVIGLGFDVTGRMISSGGKTVKVWGEQTWQDVDEEEAEDTTNGKREHESEDSDDSDEDMDDSSEEDEPKQKRKKRKRNKGKQAKGHAPGDCNCFYSALSKTSIFEIATTKVPAGEYGHFTEIDQDQVRKFVAQKRHEFGERRLQASPVQIYQPLLAGEIRVLELHPGEPGSSLHGSLHTVSIDFSYPTRPYEYGLTYTRATNHAVSLVTQRPVWFTALSYVWGANPIFDQTITSDRGPIIITRSLAAALQALRSKHDRVYLWIDQICINQPDNEEKAMQIPLMDKIYTRATNTVIWLGDDDGENPVQALDLMETVFARLQGTDAQVTPDDFKRLNFPPAKDRAWWAIRQFLRRPWFDRLWTIQEAVLSRNLYLKCGRAEVCWDDFQAWCDCLVGTGLLRWLKENVDLDAEYGKKQLAVVSSPQGATVVLSISAERLNMTNFTHRESLLNLLVTTRYANATEPKDKIYGVLGIARLDIVPDYSKKTSARQVYLQACLTQLPLLVYELLSCVDHDTPLDLSWVPDWSTQRVTAALGYSTKAWALYWAGGRIVAGQKPPKAVVSDDKKEITVSGKIFDTITRLGDIYQDPTLDIETPQESNRIMASYVKIALETSTTHSYPMHDTSIYDAFFNTLLAGRDGSGILAPTPDHSEVFSLILDCTTGQMPSLPGQTISPRRQSGHFTLDNLKIKQQAKIRQPVRTLKDLRAAFRAAMTMRRFAVTGKGYFALVPRGAQVGDEITVFDRACVPFVVRQERGAGGEDRFEMLGEAYVHGVMKGEVLDMEELFFPIYLL
ncbi:hypothetical protein PTNB73_07619 [Pyrenophora teres f. teres]|nr:hypothetical protein PTNB85_10322 [Pyrenophora teres f. teres]KAE8832068.1 hypothetical protein HRS9139_06310 [Pyrenophora teres f. teres]KAE8862065.1 hypothetical protein PTNB73_07619 [Pyrenophora teres f. teres]